MARWRASILKKAPVSVLRTDLSLVMLVQLPGTLDLPFHGGALARLG